MEVSLYTNKLFMSPTTPIHTVKLFVIINNIKGYFGIGFLFVMLSSKGENIHSYIK